MDSSAPWRSRPLAHFELLRRIIDNGQWISPLMFAPWVKSSIFKMDWLHAADQGCAADFLGNALLLIASKLPGRDKKARVDELWRRTLCRIRCFRCFCFLFFVFVKSVACLAVALVSDFCFSVSEF